MKYLCIVALDAAAGEAMTDQDWERMGGDSRSYDERLQAEGVYIAAEALEATTTSRTVRVRKGRKMITDGPFTETKEHVAGFILVDARDADHALEIAAGIPMARIGAVEVRPIMDFGEG